MAGYRSTGQSPQRAVVLMEEEEECRHELQQNVCTKSYENETSDSRAKIVRVHVHTSAFSTP
jgi:hypothetical protein